MPDDEEREAASRRAFVLVSAVNTAWRVTPALYLFLDWVKRIHSREVYTEARRRETVSQTHSFYDFIHFIMRMRAFVTQYARLLRQYRVILRRSAQLDILLCFIYIHIYNVVLYGAAFCKGSSHVSIQFSQYNFRVVQTRIEHGK